MFGYNFAGHEISIYNAILFLSKQNQTDGNICRLLTRPVCTQQHASIKFNGRTISRTGVGISIPKRYTFTRLNTPSKNIFLTEIETIQPLKILSQDVDFHINNAHSLILTYEVTVKNDSTYTLPNVILRQGGYVNQKTFGPHEEYTFNFYENRGKYYPIDIHIPAPSIYDPNSHRECSSVGDTSSLTYLPNARTLFVERDDISFNNGWRGVQADLPSVPNNDLYCVELIPYTVTGDEDFIEVPLSASVRKHIVHNDELLKTTNVNPNDEITYLIEIENTGGRISDFLFEEKFDKHLEFVSSDCGLRRSTDQLYSLFKRFFFDKEKITCHVTLRVKNDFTENKRYTLINTATAGSYMLNKVEDSAQATVDIWNDISVNKTYTLNDDNSLTFRTNISVTGNTPLKDVTFEDDCTNCEKLELLQENSNNVMLNTPITLQTGQYVFEQRYSTTAVQSPTVVRNCFYAEYDNKQKQSCTDVQISPAETVEDVRDENSVATTYTQTDDNKTDTMVNSIDISWNTKNTAINKRLIEDPTIMETILPKTKIIRYNRIYLGFVIVILTGLLSLLFNKSKHMTD
jgi:hypothetical protein